MPEKIIATIKLSSGCSCKTKSARSSNISCFFLIKQCYSGLCSSRAQWPLAPNFCSQAIRKSYFFHTNHMLGTLDFFYSFGALGSLQFSLEHSLVKYFICTCYSYKMIIVSYRAHVHLYHSS